MPTSPAPALAPGFILLQSNRLELLRQLLIDWLKTSPLAPLENETLIVQSNGMAQWLKLGMASARAAHGGGLGIATGLELIFPARLQWQCYRAIFGANAVPPDAPLDKNFLTWRLMRLLPAELNRAEFAPLRHYVCADDQPNSAIDERRLYQLALRLADQFDQYQVYRADWLTHWQHGETSLPASGSNPLKTPLAAEQLWQPRLWQAIIQDIQAEQTTTPISRAALHHAFLQAAEQQNQRPAGLPRRIIVFGLSSIAPQILEVLATVARWSQVIICLQNPCQHYWGDIIEGHQLFTRAYRGKQSHKIQPTVLPEDLHTQANPLLAAWGRQGRDLMRLLDQFDEQASASQANRNLEITAFESPVGAQNPPNLLALIQEDILDLRSPDELKALSRHSQPSDTASLQFHIAHSPLREVEILHDQLLAALQADPTLSPTDILVMAPDITEYAPSIAAIFGRIEHQDPRYIPFSVADQASHQKAPLLRAIEQLLDLPHARIDRSALLDLLAIPSLRARFGIQERDLPTLHHWINEAGIRWGLDAAHREQFGLPPNIAQNTWLFGLERLLLGYLSGAAQAPWQGIEPYPAIDTNNAELIGQLADFIGKINRYIHILTQAHTPREWQPLLQNLIADFFLTPSEAAFDDDLETHEALLTGLANWLNECQTAQFDQAITIETARHAWLNQLNTHRLQQRFLVGGVNFATLMPMRAIPYRHIYLLGMDDASYPRRQAADDFDLMASRYRPGDRARRDDDRYLFLEALLAAREKLSISWVGRHIRNNQKKPSCVMVSQLHNYLDQFWRSPTDQTTSEMLTTIHPLTPYSRQYFTPENPAIFTYANDWRAVHTHNEPPIKPLSRWLPPSPLTPQHLSAFLRAPTHVLLKERCQITLTDPDDALEDHEPFTLNNLQLWHIKQQLNARLRQQLANHTRKRNAAPIDIKTYLKQQYDHLKNSGQLPLVNTFTPEELIDPLCAQWQHWQNLTQQYAHPEPNPQQIKLISQQGIMLEASFDDIVRTDQNQHARLLFIEGKLHAKNKDDTQSIRMDKCIAHWPQHLCAQLAGQSVATYLIAESGIICLKPFTEATARQHLMTLMDAWFDAAQSPYPLACKTAFCWLEHHESNPEHPPEQALDKAKICFEDNYQTTGEQTNDAILARTWQNFHALITTPSSQNHHFTELCLQLYQPLYHNLSDHPETEPPASKI